MKKVSTWLDNEEWEMLQKVLEIKGKSVYRGVRDIVVEYCQEFLNENRNKGRGKVGKGSRSKGKKGNGL